MSLIKAKQNVFFYNFTLFRRVYIQQNLQSTYLFSVFYFKNIYRLLSNQSIEKFIPNWTQRKKWLVFHYIIFHGLQYRNFQACYQNRIVKNSVKRIEIRIK